MAKLSKLHRTLTALAAAGALLPLPLEARIDPPPGMATSAANAVLPASRTNLGLNLFNPVTDHAAPTDGATDATAAIVASLADCSAAGGGQVTLGPYQFAVTSASLTVPQNCTLRGSWWPGNERASPPNFTTKPAILLSASYTINLAAGAGLEDVAVFRNGMATPTTARQALTDIAGWSGTAITQTGDSAQVRNVYVVGFGTCFSVSGHARPYIDHFYGDCINGFALDGVHDVGVIQNFEFWPFYVHNSAWAVTTYAVSGAADNGSGAIRLTIPTNILVTGDTVQVSAVGGFTGANNRWVATVVDGTHIDLQGSQSAPETIGTWTSGSRAVAVTSLDSLAVGQTVNGVNIAAGSTISAIDFAQSVIYLSAASTGAGSNTALTFANGTFTNGGSVMLDAGRRAGTAVSVTNSETSQFSNGFVYGWDIPAHLGTGAVWISFANFSCDNSAAHDPATRCMVIDGDARGTIWSAGSTASVSTPLFVNSTNPEPQLISHIEMNSPCASCGMLFSIGKGAVTLNGVSSAVTDQAYIANTVDRVSLSGGVLAGITLVYDGARTAGWLATHTDASTILATGPRGGGSTVENLTINDLNAGGTNTLQVLGRNNVNGAVMRLGGDGGTTPDKYIRVHSGAFQILNSGYTATILGLSDAGALNVPAGGITTGASGAAGSLTMGNATSGTITLQPITGALGTVTLSLPAANDTLVGRATTDTLTNKTVTDEINQEFLVSTSTLTKTNDTSFAVVPGLSQTLTAGKTYSCHGHLTGVSGASGGIKVALVATSSLSATSATFTGLGWNGMTVVAQTTVAALGSNIIASTAVYSDLYITGSIVVNAGGVINVEAAQNVSNGTATTALAGSTFGCVRVN
jgi:hypothetical protein